MNHKLKYFLTIISTTLLGNQTAVNAETLPDTPPSNQNDSFLGKLGASTDVVPEVINFSQANYHVYENEKQAEITVTRTNCSSGSPPVSVSYASSNGTAYADSDYSTVNGRLVWGARAKGDCSSKVFWIPVRDDIVVEGNETVELHLSNPFGDVTVGENAVLTIVDNETVGNDSSIIDFSQTDYHVNEADSVATITVERTNCNHNVLSPASVAYHTTNASGNSTGTAIVGHDYVGNNGVLSWGTSPVDNCGEQSFDIAIMDNTVVESDKTINLHLDTVRGARLGQSYAALTIMENDISSGPGELSFSNSHYRISENRQAATISVNRTECGLGSPAVAVSYASSRGTAHQSDYTDVTGTLVWEASEAGDCAPKTFQVPIKDNLVHEPNETIKLQLSNPTNGAIIKQHEAVLTIIDNDFVPPTPIAPDNPGIFSFSHANYRVSERSGAAFIVVNRTACSYKSPPAVVTITMKDDTAIAEHDYTPINGILNWGITREGRFNGDCDPWYVYIPIKDDTHFENSETIRLHLSDPMTAPICQSEQSSEQRADSHFSTGIRFFTGNGHSQNIKVCQPETVKLEQSDAVLTIVDNDGSTIGFSEINYQVDENIGKATITVTRSGVGCDNDSYALPTAAISYRTSSEKPSHAASGTDYVVTRGTLLWGNTASGESCGDRQFEVLILDDPLVEDNEMINLHLGKARNAENSQSRAVLTIVDDDVSFSP